MAKKDAENFERSEWRPRSVEPAGVLRWNQRKMLTIFTTAKAFKDHDAVLQRNALKSWTLLHPDVEVILFGDDAGAEEAARELGIRYAREVERVAEGPKVLRSFFDAAQKIARHDTLCYANCDIILTDDFARAVRSVRAQYSRFLMVGRRWDVDIREPLEFDRHEWTQEARGLARAAGQQRNDTWVDYFVFSRGLYLGQLPEFVIGRVVWDHWLVWKARRSGAPVVDASEAVMAIHQNHDYGYHPEGRNGVWTDELARRNQNLAGSRWHLCTIEDATHLLGRDGLRVNPDRKKQAARRFVRTAFLTARLGLLDWTRPLRHSLGLRKKAAPQAR